MRVFLLSLTGLLVFNSVSAQKTTAEDSVKAVITTLFTAMENADEKLLLSIMADSAILQTIRSGPGDVNTIHTESVVGFARSIGKAQKKDLRELIQFEKLGVDGPLAIAWTPYEFYYKGKFSHCGYNSFQLVRSRGVWKIQYIIDTRSKGECL
ncbi:MAG: hypothetical protein EOO09_13345 [Chitinophagaceae bacterium]|nr:MAG: hypothetical protein EOO09_13345 [Chitinophagaceae bacterium]